jgi:divalent metal cation (Fe/Co/Zn/Cd) transporter
MRFSKLTLSGHTTYVMSSQLSYHWVIMSTFKQSGPSYFVEVDVVMDPNTPLMVAHDVSQNLQTQIEELPGVERAFVHVDHETSHLPVSRICGYAQRE